MIQSPTHEVCTRRANRPLSGMLAFAAGAVNAGDCLIATVMVQSAVAPPPLWQDVGERLHRRNGGRSS